MQGRSFGMELPVESKHEILYGGGGADVVANN
jgi:hypothetical protein